MIDSYPSVKFHVCYDSVTHIHYGLVAEVNGTFYEFCYTSPRLFSEKPYTEQEWGRFTSTDTLELAMEGIIGTPDIYEDFSERNYEWDVIYIDFEGDV